ncbi:CMGC family protein kinase [Histomonas meleagridis]|uniref:CMGC family protein kinase n=1 Tax=Histomonas meleagridis TaxID=135588 RepID=UPI00355A57F0|nr:CMGC family protein kinase [Histomonas meleagridis]KAH0797783.1 CMGC family protein kinase [Histomonas meleagridis]
MADLGQFAPEKAVKDGRFDPNHPYVSRVFANVNLDLGPSHYDFKIWNPQFGDISRYKLCKWVGSGRYSDVFISLQDDTKKCAIKLLKPVNPDRVRRELKILHEVQGNKNILELWDIIIDGKYGIPGMVTEAVDNSDWRDLFSKFSLEDIKFYIYSIVKALAHAHSVGVMHRDVKPLNVLCDMKTRTVKLADWGLAEFYHPLHKYSYHVGTVYYKAPEVCLGYPLYDYSIDMWAVGVSLLEALSGRIHVFEESSNDVFDSIANILGGKEILDWGAKYNVKISMRKVDRISSMKKVPFESLFPKSRKEFMDPDGMDLVYKLLVADHKKRLTAEETLAHPFFDSVRDM